MPGAECGSHDDIFLTGLEEGTVAVENPRLGRTFRLGFDHTLFRWLCTWQPYGGAHELPLAGSYALGIEPWISSRQSRGRPSPRARRSSSPAAPSLETTLTAAIEGGPVA